MTEFLFTIATVGVPFGTLIVVGLLIGWHDERHGSAAFHKLQAERENRCN